MPKSTTSPESKPTVFTIKLRSQPLAADVARSSGTTDSARGRFSDALASDAEDRFRSSVSDIFGSNRKSRALVGG